MVKKEAFIRRAETAGLHRKSRSSPATNTGNGVIVGKDDSEHFNVSIYEVPPGKSAVPYHYHLRNEEVFFILSGTGLLKSPKGSRPLPPVITSTSRIMRTGRTS